MHSWRRRHRAHGIQIGQLDPQHFGAQPVGATFAQMTRNPLGVAQQVSRSVAGALTTRPSLARLVPTL